MPETKSAKRRKRLLIKALNEAKTVQTNTGQKKKKNSKRNNRKRSGNGARGNPYLATLTNPCGVVGVKVPDPFRYPSSTLQTVYRVGLGPSGAGGGVGVTFCPIIGTGDGTGHFPVWTGTSVSVNGTVTWTGRNWANRAAIQAAYSDFRCVSACIKIVYTGTSMDDSGVGILGYYPRELSSLQNSMTTSAFADSLPNIQHIRARDSCEILWKPQDNSDLEYKDTDFEKEYADETYPVYPPTIFYLSNGMAAAGSIFIEVYANWELIPTALNTSYSIGGATPSPDNPSWFSRAMDYASSIEFPFVTSETIERARSAGRTAYNVASAFSGNSYNPFDRHDLIGL